MTPDPGASDPATRRILAVAGQGFTLGLTTAWMTIPASAIVLDSYGPRVLPFTYIGAAVAGAASSALLTRALRNRSVAAVATSVLTGLVLILVASWIALSAGGSDLVAVGLLVLVPIMVPVGFVFLVGQAGALVDLRALKTLYARVVAGFALGFVAGGLGGPLVLTVVGGTEHLLAAGALAATAFLGLVMTARRRYPTELTTVERSDADQHRPTLHSLTRDRFLALLIAFQMLSAVESQLLDFLVYNGAANRYTDTSQLADFVSRFSAIAYGVDILFLVVLAGLLLRRFGLRYGLAANAVGVLTFVGAVILATVAQGSFSTLVFVLVVAARVTDLTLSDGAARTSMSAAYQAVPARLRAVAQAAVEGLAVPLAIGMSGVILLAVDAAGLTDGVTLPTITALVVSAWTAVAVLTYREYRVSLLANLRGRTLDPAALTLEGESSLIAIDRLISSDDERDVRLGLDILTTSAHPELQQQLERLVADDRIGVRTDVLARLTQLAPDVAAAAARRGTTDGSADIRAVSIRVLGAAGSSADLALIESCADDAAREVRAAVVFALTRMGDGARRAHVVAQIDAAAASTDAAERAAAAEMLAAFDRGGPADRHSLRTLLEDPDDTVVKAALGALRSPDDQALLPLVLTKLDHPPTTGAAAAALAAAGSSALPLVDEGLDSSELTRRAKETLARVARDIGGPVATGVLARHLRHPDREVGLEVMLALAVVAPTVAAPSPGPGGTRVTDAETTADSLASAIAREDLEHATAILAAVVEFRDESGAELLCAALQDELALQRRRILAALGIRHGITGLNRVVYHLAQRDSRSHALALEWLDTTLTGTDRAVVAVLEPGRSDRQRLQALLQWFPRRPTSRHALLVDLAHDPAGRWRRPWIAACALSAAAGVSHVDADFVQAAASRRADIDTAEGRIVAETLEGLQTRRLDPV